jgi:hypothetical protein
MTTLTLCLFLPHVGFAAKAPDSAVPGPSARAIPESVFSYRAGRDPFFPNRVLTPVPAPEPAKREIMVLKGIAGTLDRRVALINDRTFSKGETGEIKSGTNEFKIRVIDIKDRSVTIERAGQTNELPLVENLLPLDGRK